MQSAPILFSQLNLNELTNAISDVVMARITPHFPSNKPPVITKHAAVYISPKETAKRIGVSLPTLRKYTRTGKITAYRIGRQVRYKEEDVTAALAKIQTI